MIEVEIDKDVYLPCYHHILDENDIDIELIWGGRDSGKSKFVAQYFTEQAMSLDYFRCILVKQTHESIKDAQWQMIKDTAEQWNVDHLFKFTESPLSIKCKNGNTFATRGMDNASKIKSFSNPSHCWIEEADQITKDSFITLLTGLRSDYGKVKLILTFNPETSTPAYEDFWIYQMFFKDGPNELSFTGETVTKLNTKGQEKTVTLKYRSTHVTYHDNPYVSDQRISFHESLSVSDPYKHRVFTLGLWGNKENDSPYAFAFDRKKHVSDPARGIPHPVLNRAHPVYLSWDFNRNPMSCLVIQLYDNHAYVLDEIRLPKSGVEGMCTHIKTYYPKCLFIVTGDYNGNNESSLFAEQVTHYLLIKSYLNLSDGQLKVLPNPKQAKNSTHINNILAHFAVTIHSKCTGLIFDLENVKRRADGTILKMDRDKPEQQADLLDCWRYFCNAFLDWFKPAEMAQEAANQPARQALLSNVNKAVYNIENRVPITCTKEEYPAIRSEVISKANQWVTTNYGIAQFALSEITRLDKLHLQA